MSFINQYQNIPLDELRKEVEQRLQWGYAHGHILLVQLEERLEKLVLCQNKDEMLTLIEDIPSPEEKGFSNEQPNTPPGEDEFMVAIFSGSIRRGGWVVPRRVNCFSLFGSCSLDLRDSIFNHGNLEIRGIAIFGSIEVKVPDDVSVTATGIPIFGSIQSRTRPTTPKKRVGFKGITIFGSFHARTKGGKR